ncbi:MAG: cyclic nucleotide-binding domain-containing protein [Magnetococcus sp. DMHC-6]
MPETEEEKRIELLKTMEVLEFFSNFTEYEKKRFSAFDTYIKVYKMGEYVVREGAMDRAFYIILDGSVSIVKAGKSEVLTQLGPGDFFGEVSFLTGRPRISNVVASERLYVIHVDSKLMERLGTEIREKIKDRIISRLVARLDDMNDLISRISSIARF